MFPRFNSGSPFLEGGEVLCEASGGGLQRAFVLEVNHLRYRLHLHNSQDINTGVTLARLLPRYALGHFTPDMDDPFKDIWSERVVKSGLYEI